MTSTLLQAVSARRRTDPTFVADGVIHHSDAGAQYVSLALTEKLLDHGVTGSIGRVGTAHDNALMESTIGLYKTELVNRRAIGWDSRQELETATARWVAWFNRERLHGELGYRPPIEIEMEWSSPVSVDRFQLELDCSGRTVHEESFHLCALPS